MTKYQKIYSEIYRKYIDKIYRFIFLKVNSQEIAEDLTSEVFIKGWEAFKKEKNQNIKNIKNFPAFLYQIARNVIVDYYREKNKINPLSIEGNNVSVADRENIEKKAILNSDLENVKIALANIKEEYREVIIWYYLDELSIKEIAQLLGKSEGAVRVQISRALKVLREEIEKRARLV